MMKIIERQKLISCWNRALDRERVFILLERDPAAPAAIRAWIAVSAWDGNREEDNQLVEALDCANLMQLDQPRIRMEVDAARKSKAAMDQGDSPMAQAGNR